METSGAVVLSKLSAPVLLQFEAVGRWYESRDARVRVLSGGSGGVVGAEGMGGESDGEEVNPLLLDPTKWKDQDHYAILGLGKLRYRATPQDIRKAYRQKVLQHHPDKQDQDSLMGDDYFKCIKIAYDILCVPKRRRAYDSIDPTFDDSVPPVSAHSRENFFELFGHAFEENMRWSTRQPVPVLGDSSSSLEEVEAFYAFWYDFDSWREFSYLDEENKEKAECREERRWMEKQNRAARQRRKKEEVTRMRTLVDNAYTCDPRVRWFKEAEKAEKLAKRRAKDEATRQEILEKEKERQRRLQEERAIKEREEEEAQAQAAQAKKEKEMQKKAVRKERKKFRDACKTHGYFADGEGEVAARMEEVERMCDALSMERLQEVNEKFSRLSTSEARTLFEEEVAAIRRRDQEEIVAAAKVRASHPSTSSTSVVDSEWSREELQVLVKAVTLYPAGTVQRWETIAGFVNTHSPDGSREKTARQVLAKVKTLQKLDTGEKMEVNKLAFSRFTQDHVKRGHVEAKPTERYDGPRPWTAEEQKLLEKGLRTYPANTPDRWDKIAEVMSTRTKAECITRFKELVAQVKAKKQQSS